MVNPLSRISRETKQALAITLGLLLAGAVAITVIYFLVAIRSVQSSNSGILQFLSTNHGNNVKDLQAICHALKGCVFPPLGK